MSSSLTVIATVISRPAPDRAVIDAGLKTLSDDSGPARLSTPRLELPPRRRRARQAHGRWPAQAAARSAGRRPRRLIPSHIDTTINLHDVMYAHRGGTVEATWAIAARGKVQ